MEKPLTLAMTVGLLTATGAETLYDTTQVINFCIDGKAYRKATVANGATPTTDGNTSEAFTALSGDKVSVFVWALNASGTVSVYQGEIQDVDGETDLAKNYPQFPHIPNDVCPFAYTVVQTSGSLSGTFTFGSDNWNTTGVTATSVDIATLPSRPQVS